jgi:hypothetical protein
VAAFALDGRVLRRSVRTASVRRISGNSSPPFPLLAAGNTGHSQKRGFGLSTQVDVAERIRETFYSFSPAKKTWLSLGFQRIANPGYNRDRGPADFLSLRIHAEI